MTFEEWVYNRFLYGAVDLDPSHEFIARCAWDAATKQMQERFENENSALKAMLARYRDETPSRYSPRNFGHLVDEALGRTSNQKDVTT